VLVVLTSAKGSPGVTTATVALAAAWPPQWRPSILECDASGGDLAAGFGLSAEPGLLTLASAARRDRRPGLLWEHTQEMPGGLAVTPAPASAEQATAAIDVLMSSPVLNLLLDHAPGSDDDAETLQRFEPRRHDESPSAQAGAVADDAVVLADMGRLPPHLVPGSGVSRLLAAADVVLLVVRNEQQGIVHAAARLDALRAAAGGNGAQVRMLLAGAATFSATEVALTLKVPVAGMLPTDDRAAAVLLGRPARRAANLARLPLIRAAAAIGRQLGSEYSMTRPGEDAEKVFETGEVVPAEPSGRPRGRRSSGDSPHLREQVR
jgi:MinD-like ATPase involved in chromosome partitioning or flagellar assembly